MRPHDIIVLMKIISYNNMKWYMKDLSHELLISASEISESINRSVISGLLSPNKKSVRKLALLDFLRYGLPYVYPQRPGSIVRGMPTAHSAPPLNELILSQEIYVWPYAYGNSRGQAIEPLHPKIPNACINDTKFYELVSLVDALRVGKSREKKLAIELLTNMIENVKESND